jgi:hypothetical protein
LIFGLHFKCVKYYTLFAFGDYNVSLEGFEF